MNTKQKTVGVCSTLLAATLFAFTPLTAQISWTGSGTYTQDFSAFNGTEGTLPTGFTVESAESPHPFVPGGSGGTVDGTNSTTGFRTFRLPTSSIDPNKRWFGIFEGSALSDSRLFAEIHNTSGATITSLRVRYRAAIWRDGARQNSIRLKYNNSTGGFSSVSDSDVWVPSVNAGGNVAYDGNDSAYSSQRDVVITLPTPLANNATGYLRWQYSTNSGSGSRDGNGITDIQIDAISEGATYPWDGGSGNWTDSNWQSGDDWISGRKASFSGTGSTVSVNDDFTVNGLAFNSTGWTLADSGGLLTLAGSVTISNVAHTATINADIAGVDLVKNGAGTLVLGGDASLTGDLKVFAGTVRIGSGFTISNTARIDLGNSAVFDLDGNDLTVRGLTGAESGTVDIDGAILTLVQNGSGTSYRGAIIGNGDLIKTGTGEQEFQDTVKVYTGDTVIDQGTLAVTINGIPTNTAGIYVNGPETEANPAGYGELLLEREGTYEFGSALVSDPAITLEGGWLSSDTDLVVSLVNPIVLVQPSGVDDDNQGRPDLGNQIYARGADGVLELSGAITGSGGFRKQAQGELILSNAGNTYSGGTNIRRGTLTIPSGGSLGTGPLLFTNDEETRTLALNESATVSLLDGNSPDPAEMGVNNAFLAIASGKTLTVDQADEVYYDELLEEWIEITTHFQGEISGAGNFVKDGKGYLGLSRYAKTLTGSVSINEGVLDVSAPAALASVSAINVAQGGQLRLGTNGTGVSYSFGGPINLGSTQRATGGDLQSDRGFGIEGGLRYDPTTGVNTATISSALVVTANADIHVNGADKTLTLSGALSSSGSYDLARTGGGTVVITGTATGYNGTLTLRNGATVINTSLGNTLTPVAITVSSTSGAIAPASLSGTGTVNGSVSYATDSGIIVSASTPVLTINGNLDLGTATIDTSGVGSGTYNLFDVLGTPSYGSVTIVGGGSISVSGTLVRITK
jgi:autotransporter-associated beta strand protein